MGIHTIEPSGQIIASFIIIGAESVQHGDEGRIGPLRGLCKGDIWDTGNSGIGLSLQKSFNL